MSEFETLNLSRPRPGVALVELNRPEVLNALDGRMFEELPLACEQLAAEPEVRVVVITGAGRGFCAGADLSSIAELPGAEVEDFYAMQRRGASAIVRIKRVGVPTIAAVNGPAAGGGLALALACDIRVAAPAARFNVAFIRLGLSGCDVGVSWLLPRIVGLGRASELMLSGRLVEAEEAERIGLVSEVAAADELIDRACDHAERVAANSAFGLELTKEALELAADAPSLEAAIAIENRNQVLASRSRGMGEALAAFAERRAR